MRKTNIAKHEENLNTKSKANGRAKFEQIPEIIERIKRSKLQFSNGRYYSPEWVSQACNDEDFVNNFYEGWLSRRREIDDLEKKLLLEKLSKTSHKLASEEKDKQIEAVNLILTELKNSKYMHSANKSYNAILIEKLEKALRGTHE